MPDASGVRMDQAAASWTNLLLVLLIAGAVVGGSVLLAGFQSLLDHVQITEEAVLVGSSWHGNHSGWSRPLSRFPDHEFRRSMHSLTQWGGSTEAVVRSSAEP